MLEDPVKLCGVNLASLQCWGRSPHGRARGGVSSVGDMLPVLNVACPQRRAS